MTPPVLHTPRLTLGPATLAHFEAFAAFCQSEHSRFMGGPGDRRDAWESVATHAGQWTLRGYGSFFLSLSGSDEPVGRVGIWHPEWLAEPELSWVVYEPHAQQGYAVEAAAAVLDWAHHSLHLPPLMSLIDAPNTASEGVAKRLGAQVEGTHTYESGKSVNLWRHRAGGII